MENNEINDLAGRDLWDKLYSKEKKVSSVEDIKKTYISKRKVDFLQKYLTHKAGSKILEVGCAQSIWLPYFKKEFGYEIWGIDYSKKGCDLAKEILKNCEVDGFILHRDLLNDDISDLYNQFEVVISFGLIEHFNNTEFIINIFKKFLNNDGIIITLIPNYNGLIGVLQKRLGRNIYRSHKIINKEDLENAHSAGNFNCVFCNYFGSFNLCMLIYEDITGFLMRMFSITGRVVTETCWYLFDKLNWHPESKLLSPYIVYVGEKNLKNCK